MSKVIIPPSPHTCAKSRVTSGETAKIAYARFDGCNAVNDVPVLLGQKAFSVYNRARHGGIAPSADDLAMRLSDDLSRILGCASCDDYEYEWGFGIIC